MQSLIKLLICIFGVAFAAYGYINALNELTKVRLLIPQVQKELHETVAENERLRYEIDQFESPLHLMELARKPEFSHLKFPYVKDVLEIRYQEEIKANDSP